jgi:hypothetical protein
MNDPAIASLLEDAARLGGGCLTRDVSFGLSSEAAPPGPRHSTLSCRCRTGSRGRTSLNTCGAGRRSRSLGGRGREHGAKL